jgi:hypothetical protein
MAFNLNQIFEGPLKFTIRPIPVPGELRLPWKLALVLLIVGYSRGKRASIQKLHSLNHFIRTSGNRERILAVAKGTRPSESLVVRFDPALTRALDLARGEGLVEINSTGRVQLTTSGEDVLKAIDSDEELLTAEKEMLRAVATWATEQEIKRILRGH